MAAQLNDVCRRTLLQLMMQLKTSDLIEKILLDLRSVFCVVASDKEELWDIVTGFSCLHINFIKNDIQSFKETFYVPEIVLQIKKLRDFPETQDPDCCKIVKWVRCQATYWCAEYLKEEPLAKYLPFTSKMMKISKQIAENNFLEGMQQMCHAISCVSVKPFEMLHSGLVDIMLSYFLSPTLMSERSHRARAFVEIMSARQSQYMIITVFENLVRLLLCCFDRLFCLVLHTMNEISESHHYKLSTISCYTSYIGVRTFGNNNSITNYEVESKSETSARNEWHGNKKETVTDDDSRFTNFYFFNDLMKVVQLLSTLYWINNHWGELLKIVVEKPIIDNALFSIIRVGLINEIHHLNCKNNAVFTGLKKAILAKCPFLLNVEDKKEMMSPLKILESRIKDNYLLYFLSRESVVNGLHDMLQLTSTPAAEYWMFRFYNEIGDGHGVTKEVYSIFSRVIQRSDLDLWLGELQGDDDLIVAKNGLYPSPGMSPGNEGSIICHFFMTGVMMAKSIQDHQILDIPFNRVFFKWLINSDNDREVIDLGDLKEVCPHHSNLLTSLENVIHMKEQIISDSTLTYKEMEEAISNLTIDGTSFEDMDLDFTLPGYDHIEMIENGKDIALSPWNVQQYVDLLILWFLRQGPRVKLEFFKEGFERIMPISRIIIASPEDLHLIVCGESFRPWTKDELWSACLLKDGYSLTSMTIEYLFVILSNFNSEEQKQFLQFTTSSSKLPMGGLKSLDPPLTISCTNYDHPDKYLPTSSTCFNTLRLPQYKSVSVTKEKLFYAMKEGSGSFHLV